MTNSLAKPEVIITHESDLDGLVSGVLLQRLARKLFNADVHLEAYAPRSRSTGVVRTPSAAANASACRAHRQNVLEHGGFVGVGGRMRVRRGMQQQIMASPTPARGCAHRPVPRSAMADRGTRGCRQGRPLVHGSMPSRRTGPRAAAARCRGRAGSCRKIRWRQKRNSRRPSMARQRAISPASKPAKSACRNSGRLGGFAPAFRLRVISLACKSTRAMQNCWRTGCRRRRSRPAPALEGPQRLLSVHDLAAGNWPFCRGIAR